MDGGYSLFDGTTLPEMQEVHDVLAHAFPDAVGVARLRDFLAAAEAAEAALTAEWCALSSMLSRTAYQMENGWQASDIAQCGDVAGAVAAVEAKP